MMARARKSTAKKKTESKSSKSKKSAFHKILTAEGWRRLMMGKRRKKK